jgi:hypothetical protein
MPATNPNENPKRVRNVVPSRRSSHWPARPGRNISSETAITRAAQSKASPIGLRSLGGRFKGALGCMRGKGQIRQTAQCVAQYRQCPIHADLAGKLEPAAPLFLNSFRKQPNKGGQ